jgi:hypothetical protein
VVVRRRRRRVRVVHRVVVHDVDSVLVLRVEVKIVAEAVMMLLTVAWVAAGQELPAGGVQRATALTA